MAWSDAARAAALETRRRKAKLSPVKLRAKARIAGSEVKKLEAKYNSQVFSRKVSIKRLRKTRDALIKARFDAGY